MKYKVIIQELTHDDLVSILSDINYYSNYWIDSWQPIGKGYEEAKMTLISEGMQQDEICFEDIFAKVLEMKKRIEIESEEGIYYLTYSNLKKGVEMSMNEGYCPFEFDDWDASHCDIALQMALFDMVVFG